MQKVSTTRGVPSSSTDLKEALCEKIPLHYDLLRKFRARHGSSVISEITVNDLYNGLRDVSTVVRETSEIDALHGVRYRGLTIPEVLRLLPRRGNAPIPEAVFWLLLTGDVPTQEQTASLIADWTSRRQKRRSWWYDSGNGSSLGTILQSLPKNLSPLSKLSIALTALDSPGKRPKENTTRASIKTTSYTRWEHTYEEGMELLATLPAIVGLVRQTGEEIKGNPKEDGDWVDFFLECSAGFMDTNDGGKKTSFGDFLRLYIAVNADEDGGTPAAHITQILGTSGMELSEALASGVTAYSNEPNTGTMHQYINFQLEIQNILGKEPNDEALKNFTSNFFENDKEIIGYKDAAFCDPRYAAFADFARENLPESSEIKLSKIIARILSAMASSNERNLSPEQTTLTAPIFRFYGLKDMEFNQVLLCMSRALGAVASIIWTRAVDTPVEHPKSHSTYTYFDSFRDSYKSKPKPQNQEACSKIPDTNIPSANVMAECVLTGGASQLSSELLASVNESETVPKLPSAVLMTHSSRTLEPVITATHTSDTNIAAPAMEQNIQNRTFGSGVPNNLLGIRPLVTQTCTQPAISLASWFNMQLQDRQTPAVRSPSSDSYVINVDEEMTTESSTQIRDETEHEHHHYHHTTMTDNYLNNIREATTSTSQSNNNNNNNNSEDDTSVTVPLSSETRDSLRSLFDICNKFLPFATILLVKFVYDHKSGLLQFSGLLLAFIYANKDLKREIAKQHNKSWKCLLSILIYIFACYFAVYFIFEEPLVRMYTVPTTMWELLWSVVMTDMVLKLGTVAMKVIVTCLPAKILPYQKRGKYYLVMEASSQFYRSTAPVYPWVFYLWDCYEGPEAFIAHLFAIAYGNVKLTDVLGRGKLLWSAFKKMCQNMNLGVSPSRDQLVASGSVCAICHEEYTSPVLLQCKHIFCESCVTTWLDRERTCPLCRAPISDDPIYRDGHTTDFIQWY